MVADPAAPVLKTMPALPADIRVVVSNRLEELTPHTANADIILYADGDGDLLARVLSLAPRVRWIHCLWTGVEGILKPEMQRHPAPLTNGRGVFRWPLADWVAGVMLYFSFDFPRVLQQQQQRLWKPFVSKTLSGFTLGIVGYGSIGSAAAARARVFGMKVAALRRRPALFETEALEDPRAVIGPPKAAYRNDPEGGPDARNALVDRFYLPSQLKDLMAASDYLLVCTPLTDETRGLVGKSEIAAMKSSAVLMNIGRGPVVDESALLGALQAGAIRGAALDVFDTEPLPSEHPFWGMPQVLLSPHTADRVEGFLNPAWESFLENLNRYRDGQPLINVVDKQAGY
jgi:phosphoglycerate dehydrogenase-like enzyme